MTSTPVLVSLAADPEFLSQVLARSLDAAARRGPCTFPVDGDQIAKERAS